MLKNIELNDADEITSPHLHDSNLIKIETDSNTVKITFLSTDDSKHVMTLSGVKKFLCNDFSEGNIVLDVTFIYETEIVPLLLKKLYCINEFNEKSSESFIQSIKNDIEEKKLYLLQVNPSYGASILSLCKSVDVELLANR